MVYFFIIFYFYFIFQRNLELNKLGLVVEKLDPVCETCSKFKASCRKLKELQGEMAKMRITKAGHIPKFNKAKNTFQEVKQKDYAKE